MARGGSAGGESPANKQDWHDGTGRMRALRETLAAVYPAASLRRLADAFGLSVSQYSLLETGQRAWSLDSFARVAGGLLGTLQGITGRSWTLHSIIPAAELAPADPAAAPRPRRPVEPPAPRQQIALPPNAPALPTSRPSAPYSWQIEQLRIRISQARGEELTIARLAREVAATAGQAEQWHSIDQVLRRIISAESSGSLPTLFKLYAHAAPLLASPNQALLLDDILVIERWQLGAGASSR
jgi:transcriptional regulator with XRE-family HTH domain